MRQSKILVHVIYLALTVVVVACANPTAAPTTAPAVQATSAPTTAPAPTSTRPAIAATATLAPSPTTAARAARAQVIVLSNSAPHVSVLDAESNQVVKTADIPRMTSWTWNDDNNYYDGKNLWLGMRNPDTNDVELVLLDLDTLQIARRIPLGQDKTTLYIGKASRDGKLFVSKHASGQMVVIDLKTFAVLRTVDLPVSGGVACDMDVSIGADGMERAFVPTDNGNTVLSIDTSTYQVLQTLSVPEGTRPFMLTVSPDGRRVWVQERTSNGNVVLDALTLQVVQRVPTGAGAIVNTFSPDGKVSFTGHAAATAVTAHDAQTFKELWRAQVGSNPDKLGVHPAGTFVYAIVNKEAALAVLEAASGKVVTRVPLGTNPTGIYVRSIK